MTAAQLDVPGETVSPDETAALSDGGATPAPSIRVDEGRGVPFSRLRSLSVSKDGQFEAQLENSTAETVAQVDEPGTASSGDDATTASLSPVIEG